MGNPLMGMIGNMMGNSNNSNPMIGMLMSMMGGGKPNPNMIMQQLMQTNPQAKQMWQQVQQMTQGKSEQEIQGMVNELAQKNGIDQNTLNQIISKFK